MKLSDKLLRAYNQRDDVTFDAALATIGELVEILEDFWSQCPCVENGKHHPDCDYCNKARAALRRARGEE